jgi:glyoxylate reductase
LALDTVFISSDLPEDLRVRLKSQFNVVDVPEGTTTDLQQYGDPVGWYMDGGTAVGADVLSQLPSLRVLSNHGVGYDSINVADATAANVVVSNTPGVLDSAVAELTLGFILMLGRQMHTYDRYIRDGSWEKEWAPLTNDVHGKTLGIVGMGRIGRRLAEIATALGMKVRYHNRSRNQAIEDSGLAEWAEWDDLLAQSDFISVHTPLTDRTRGFFDKGDFAKMKQTGYFINMARGAVVNTDDLLAALQDGEIAGAGLDVFDVEPLPASHPLLKLDNVVVQPHNGSATVETRRAMVELAIENLETGSRRERPRTALNWEAINTN